MSTKSFYLLRRFIKAVEQLAERSTCNWQDPGSNPGAGLPIRGFPRFHSVITSESCDGALSKEKKNPFLFSLSLYPVKWSKLGSI